MPLVVSSLTGDASDMFDWTCSVTPGGTQDLFVLLQMLREHYCGSSHFGSRGTWSGIYARELTKMPLIL